MIPMKMIWLDGISDIKLYVKIEDVSINEITIVGSYLVGT